MTSDTSHFTMDSKKIVQNDETITESCYNEDALLLDQDANDQSTAVPTIDSSINSPTERHKAWQKRKRQGTSQRAKERRVAEWSELSEEQQEERKVQRKERMELMDQKLLNALQDGLNVCIDLSFDGVNVSDKERTSVCKQLSLSWAVLKQAMCPVHLHLTSLNEDTPFGLSLKKQVTPFGLSLKEQGMPYWKISRHQSPPWDAFPQHSRDKIVVLSPDATDVLTEFSRDEVYVIGGIVDRSVRKAESLDYATFHGLSAKRLPIQEYLPQRQSHILNIDHVVHTICLYQHCQDWSQTLLASVPLRRQIQGGKKQRKEERKQAVAVAAGEVSRGSGDGEVVEVEIERLLDDDTGSVSSKCASIKDGILRVDDPS